jgi:hypothetical protein
VDRDERAVKGTVQKFRSVEDMSAAPIIVSPTDGFERCAARVTRARMR